MNGGEEGGPRRPARDSSRPLREEELRRDPAEFPGASPSYWWPLGAASVARRTPRLANGKCSLPYAGLEDSQ